MSKPDPATAVPVTPAANDSHARAADRIDPDAVLDLASRLVRLRTVHDRASSSVQQSGQQPAARPVEQPVEQPAEQPAADLLAEVMTSYGWHVTVTNVAPGRPNVVAVIEGRAVGRTLMFEGHTDVVTEGDPAAWSFDPYAGDIVDGFLRGRGAADMKGGLAAMLHAARAVEQAGFAGRLIVAALADEEGMMAGVKAFAAGDLAQSGVDGVIVCEPEAGEICTVAKGALRIAIDYIGVMAHGAMPQMGRNPIPALGPLLVGIAELERQLQHSVGPHPELGEFYVTPTIVAAGDTEQLNVIPAVATLRLDVRTVPATPHAPLLQLLERLARDIADEAGLGCQFDVIDDRAPVETPEDADVVRALVAAHRDIVGAEPTFGGVPGTTDGTILSRDARLQTVVYGPGGKWIAHQADEMCAAADIVTAARVYAEAAERFFAGSW
jgi:succinyl-diaminopimelate desuccinylase